jgi:hypothetical protein
MLTQGLPIQGMLMTCTAAERAHGESELPNTTPNDTCHITSHT